MKKISKILLVWLAITIATQGIQIESFAVVIDETVTVGAGATKPEDIVPSSSILDNFNDGGVTNRWGGSTGAFTGNGGTCTILNDSSVPFEGDFCLKLNYDVTAATSYSGYYTQLQSTNFSTRGYLGIRFYVKGAVGGEFFKIEIKNNGSNANTNQASLYITDYLDGGVTTSWRPVNIPFHNFANISDWTSMKELVITFEGDNARTNGSPDAGTIYIDKIEFITDSSIESVVRIDHYSDNLAINALGGTFFASGGGGAGCWYSFAAASGTYHNYQRGLRLIYDVSPTGSYSYCSTFVGGGSDRWQKIPHDFSDYNYISFYIRADSSTRNPEGIKIELHDFSGVGAGEPFYTIGMNDANDITTSWKKFKIPLSSFKDWDNIVLDKSRISEIVFAFEYWNAADKTGRVYIDEVQFEKQ